MKALITGGAGLIGGHLADLLLDRGWQVAVVDTLVEPTHPNRLAPDWFDLGNWLDVDVRDPDLDRLIRGCDVVFHQAAAFGFGPPGAATLTTDVNCTGTANVVTAAARAGVGRVVVASSQAVYGDGYGLCPEHGVEKLDPRWLLDLEAGRWEIRCPQLGIPLEPVALSERHDPNPRTIYALSKLYAEQTALRLGAELGVEVVALRYGLTYGPRQSPTNPYTGIVAIFANRIRNDLPPVIYEDGRQLRDLTYVTDVAEANLIAATHPDAPGRVFNVGTGIGTPVAEIVDRLSWRYQERGAVTQIDGSFRPGDARHVLVDSAELRALGWQPTVGVEEGLRRYAEWSVWTDPAPDTFTAAEAEQRAAGVVR